MSLGNRLTIDVPGHRIHPHSVVFAGYECVCTRASRRMFIRKELMRSGAAGACTNMVGWWLNSQQPASSSWLNRAGADSLFSCCIAAMLSSASPLIHICIHTHTLDVVCQQMSVYPSLASSSSSSAFCHPIKPRWFPIVGLSLRNVAQLVRPCRHTRGVMLHDAVWRQPAADTKQKSQYGDGCVLTVG